MDFLIILLALALLIAAAYRGVSIVLCAPLAALLAVLWTAPHLVLPMFSGLFMERMVGFIKLYFPVFMLGAVFGKLMEISGLARALIQAALRFIGPKHAILAVVATCALLTYGGVSLFVVAFAVYPFAAELFRSVDIPKRLLPGAIALGSFTFTMTALPGSPQIQNIIPTAFFHTHAWAAPRLGLAGAFFILAGGLAYLEWRRRRAARAGEGYGTGHSNEPSALPDSPLRSPWLALCPLLMVGVMNFWLTRALPAAYESPFDFAAAGFPDIPPLDTARLTAIWSVECALLTAIAFILVVSYRQTRGGLAPSLTVAVAGAMLAALNTGSEFGFGAVIAALPGFRAASEAMMASIQDPLLNLAVTTNVLAGLTGSASGGMSIVLGAMGENYLAQGAAAGIPAEVLHRVAAMASGGMDTLPHNGAVITLLAVTGLNHLQSYGDILAITIITTLAVGAVIALYYLTGMV